MATGGEIHSVDCRWLSKIDRPPWIGFVPRDCTVRAGAVSSVTTAVVGITSWIREARVIRAIVRAALISQSV